MKKLLAVALLLLSIGCKKRNVVAEPTIPAPILTQEEQMAKSVKKIGNGKSDWCSGFVIGTHYVMTAAHCVPYNMAAMLFGGNPFTEDLYFDRKVKLTIVGLDQRRDAAVLSGDFSAYPKLNLKSVITDIGLKTNWGLACGYPSMQPNLACSEVLNLRYFNFGFAGSGRLLPGMSGGPLMDRNTSNIIGINSAVLDENAFFVDVVSLLEGWGVVLD